MRPLLTGKTRTDFVLEAARHAAEAALLDRTVLAVSPDAYDEFLARLDAPPKPNTRLRRTLQTVRLGVGVAAHAARAACRSA